MRYLKLSTIIALVLMAGSCGGEKKSNSNICEKYLLASFDQAGAKKTSEIRTFAGKMLYEYIDGGAEIYHSYKFIEAATADYNIDQTEMTVDIYRFENGDYAYGLYASQRPESPQFISVGAEGFRTSTSIDFVKSDYVVRIIAFEKSDSISLYISNLASAIDTELPSDKSLPSTFAQFPLDYRLPGTDMFYAESFLGQIFLTDVFNAKYAIDSDTVSLFYSDDPAGEKFGRWFELGAVDGTVEMGPGDLPFDNGKSLITTSSYYGQIIAGEKNSRLVGIVNYSENQKGFLSRWLDSMQ